MEMPRENAGNFRFSSAATSRTPPSMMSPVTPRLGGHREHLAPVACYKAGRIHDQHMAGRHLIDSNADRQIIAGRAAQRKGGPATAAPGHTGRMA